MNDAYPNALDELGLDPIDRPVIDFDKEMPIGRGKPFKVIVKVVCAPEPELKKYKGLEVEKLETKVTADDVKNELEALQRRNARIVSVDRPAKKDDTVVIDYKGFVGEEQFEGGTAENHPLVLGSGSFIPGFEDQLIGVKAGESRDVKVTFPAEYHAENLAGKEAVFRCTVHEVKETELPALDDDFAAEASEFDTLAELKKDIKKNLEADRKKENESIMKNAMLDELVKENLFDVPEVMIEEEIDMLVREFDQRLQYQGLSLDMYLQYGQMKIEDFRKQYRDQAIQRVRATLLVQEVAKAEKIVAYDEDVEAEIKSMASDYGMKEEDVRKILGENTDRLKADITNRKAIDWLFSQAKLVEKVEEKAPAKKAAPKKAAAKKEEEPAEKKAAPKKKAPAKKAAAKKEEE